MQQKCNIVLYNTIALWRANCLWGSSAKKKKKKPEYTTLCVTYTYVYLFRCVIRNQSFFLSFIQQQQKCLSLSLFLLSIWFFFVRIVDLPEIKGNHRKFRTLVTSYIGKAKKTTTTKATTYILNNRLIFYLIG